MKCYAYFDKGVVFTEDALKQKVEKIIKNCWEKKNSYDDYFDYDIPNFSNYLSENDCMNDVLMDILLNKSVSAIEELEEDFFNWSFETYYKNLICDEITEMEFEE